MKKSTNAILITCIKLKKVKPLHTMLPKTRAYVKSYDGQTKWMYFLTEDDEILEKQYILLSISGTSTGPKKMVP